MVVGAQIQCIGRTVSESLLCFRIRCQLSSMVLPFKYSMRIRNSKRWLDECLLLINSRKLSASEFRNFFQTLFDERQSNNDMTIRVDSAPHYIIKYILHIWLNSRFQSSRRQYWTIKSQRLFRLANSSRSSPVPFLRERSTSPVRNNSYMMSFLTCNLMSQDRIAQNRGVFPSNVCMFKIS